MVDWSKMASDRLKANDLRRQQEKRKVQEGQPMCKVVGGPCDGTEVLTPPKADLGKMHGIGLPAGPEHQELSSDKQTWCVYMWLPRHQQYRWVDFYQAADQGELRSAMRHMANVFEEEGNS